MNMTTMQKIWLWLQVTMLKRNLARLAWRASSLQADAAEIRRDQEALEERRAEQVAKLLSLQDTGPGGREDLEQRLQMASLTLDEYQAWCAKLEDCIRRELWGKAARLVAESDAETDAMCEKEAV